MFGRGMLASMARPVQPLIITPEQRGALQAIAGWRTRTLTPLVDGALVFEQQVLPDA